MLTMLLIRCGYRYSLKKCKGCRKLLLCLLNAYFQLRYLEILKCRLVKILKLCLNPLLSGSPICHSATIIRKTHLIALGGYDEQIDKLVDLTLWKDFMVNNFKIYGNRYPLTYHRVHEAQSFEKRNRVNYLFAAFKIRLALIKELKISKTQLCKPVYTFLYSYF